MGNARLPIPGKDEGRWGDILNEYLLVSHTEDGSLRSSAPTAGVVDEVYVTNAIQGKVNRTELSAVATTGSYNDLLNTPDLVLTNDARLTNTRTPTDNTVSTNKLMDDSITEPKLAANNTPNNGDVLTWNGAAFSWQVPATPPVQSVNGRTGAVVVSKADLGIENVNNTSDANKPVSTAMQAALDFKADEADLAAVATTGSYDDLTNTPDVVLNNDARLTNTRTPTDGSVTEPKLAISNSPSNGDFIAWDGSALTWTAQTASPIQSVNGHTGAVVVTKSDVGLGNADNTSDANKPVSTATQTALNLKADTSSLSAVATSGNYNDLANRPTFPTAGTGSGNYAAGNDARITGALQSTIVTTKGDLLAATGSSSLNRVPVGTNGQVLTADSSEATGVKWATVATGGGGIARTIVTVSANQTAAAAASTDYVYILTGSYTLTLPTAAGNTNRYTIKNRHSASVALAFNGGETADGGGITLSTNSSVDLVSDGSNWVII